MVHDEDRHGLALQKNEDRGRPPLRVVRSFQYFHELDAPPPAPKPEPIDYRGRRARRMELLHETFGAFRVVRFVGVRHGKAIWRAVCSKELGGCGREVAMPGSRLRRREHCGCQRARRLEHGGVKLTIAGWAAKLGIAVDTLEWRLQHWPLSLALTVPPRRRQP